MNNRKEVAEVVGPNDKCEHTLPEGELKVADGKEPQGYPSSAPERMILDLNFVHHAYSIERDFSVRYWS